MAQCPAAARSLARRGAAQEASRDEVGEFKCACSAIFSVARPAGGQALGRDARLCGRECAPLRRRQPRRKAIGARLPGYFPCWSSATVACAGPRRTVIAYLPLLAFARNRRGTR